MADEAPAVVGEDDELEGCGFDDSEMAVEDQELVLVVLSPEGDPARIEEYHRLAVGGGGA